MKNINKEVYQIICNNLKINGDDYSYYKSGLCSDLFVNKDKKTILKIVKWHILTDNIEDVINKYREKKDFLDYLISNKLNINNFTKRKNPYSIIDYSGGIYIGYLIDYLNIENGHDRVDEIKLIARFHELSKNYKYLSKYDWKDDFNSVLSLCKDKKLYEKMLYFKDKFNNMTKKNYGLIHFDLNKNNFVRSNNNSYIIDFDTITTGFYEMDIAGYLFSNFVIDFMNNKYIDINERIEYLNLINEHYKADKSFLKRVDIFMQYRRLFLYIIQKNNIDKSIQKEIEKDIIENNIILPYDIELCKKK